MAVFCNIMMLVLGAVVLVTYAGLIPLEELTEIILPYVHIMSYVVIALLVLKYAVYIFITYRDIRYLNDAEHRQTVKDYLILGVYPVCDFIRVLVCFGLLGAIFFQQVQAVVVFSLFIDHAILLLLVMAAFFIDYFSKDSESVLGNAIPTAVFVLLVVVFSKGLFWQGVQVSLQSGLL